MVSTPSPREEKHEEEGGGGSFALDLCGLPDAFGTLRPGRGGQLAAAEAQRIWDQESRSFWYSVPSRPHLKALGL